MHTNWNESFEPLRGLVCVILLYMRQTLRFMLTCQDMLLFILAFNVLMIRFSFHSRKVFTCFLAMILLPCMLSCRFSRMDKFSGFDPFSRKMFFD